MARIAEGFEVYDRRFARTILANAGLEVLATGFRWIEGPVWMGDWDCLLFQDLPRNRTMRWSERDGVTVFRAPSDYANGQARDGEGRLVACSHRGRRVVRTEHDGRITVLADRHGGRRLNAPNDVVVRADGTIWFTDPVYGISNDYEGGRQASEQPPALYRLDPATGALAVAAADFDGPNGLAFSPDGRRLYVCETGDQAHANPRQHIRAFDVAEDGRLSDGGIFHTVSPGYCDGLKVDADGDLWASAADGVHCISPDGGLLGKVLVPDRVSNVAWGEVHRNRLFIAGSRTLYAIHLNRRGAALPGEGL